MRGHRQVITARREGWQPAAVFIELVDRVRRPASPYDEPEQRLRHGLYPSIEIERADLRRALDLRFLVGLQVHVQGDAIDADMHTLLDLIEQQRPRQLVVCAGDALMQWRRGEWQAWTF